jgi:hypothetical protein
MVMEQPKLKQVLQEKNWASPSSLFTMRKLNAKLKDDLCTIFLDARNQEPEVLEVSADVFQDRSRIVFGFERIAELKELYATLEIKSNPELMECLRQSQKDKKKGDVRKFEDIARECELSL